MTTLDQLTYYVANGLHILPIHSTKHASGCSCRNETCEHKGKHPRTVNGVHDATDDLDQVKRWLEQWPDCNWAVATGKISGVGVCDIDPRHGGDISMQHLIKQHMPGQGSLPPTPCSQTGGRGWHYWYRYPKTHKVLKNRSIAPGVDMKFDNGYVIVPPSKTVDEYVWLKTFDDLLTAEMPGWMVDLSSKGHMEYKTDEQGQIPQGSRNSYLTSLGGSMRRRGMHFESIHAALKIECELVCGGYDHDKHEEVEYIARSVCKYEPDDTFLHQFNDDLDIDVRMNAVTSERTVLGYLLGEYDKSGGALNADICSTLLSEHFMVFEHSRIYQAILNLWKGGVSISSEMVQYELERLGEWGKKNIDKIYFLALIENGGSVMYPADLRFHTMRALQAYMLRESTMIFNDGVQQSKRGVEDPEDLIAAISSRLMRLLDAGSEKMIFTVKESTASVRLLLEAAKRGELMLNEPTGWPHMDDMIIGLPRGEVTIFAARPSHGKTAFVIQMMHQMTQRWHERGENACAIIYSAEMCKEQLMLRNVSRQSHVDSTRLRTWKKSGITQAEEKRVWQALDDFDETMNYYIDETPAPTGSYMLAKALAINAVCPVRLVIVDFLELVGDDKRGQARDKIIRMEESLRKLKELAKRLNCCVVVISQVNREDIKRASISEPKPRPSDLSWADMAEKIANMVFMLWHPYKFFKDGLPYDQEPDPETFYVSTGKNRDGKIGDIEFRFIRQFGEFLPGDTDQQTLTAFAEEGVIVNEMIDDPDRNDDLPF